MATTKLGGVSLAAPIWTRDGYERAADDVGTFHEMADGKIVLDYVNQREKYTLRWAGITATERNTIRTRYDIKTVQAFEAPDGSSSINVLVVPGSYVESYVESDSSVRYYVEIRLEESPS